MKTYEEFIQNKGQSPVNRGFEPLWMPDAAFDFQRSLTEWAIRIGRGELMASCGLGKSLMEMTWAQNVVLKTNARVLVLAPMSVAPQTVREGEKFGIESYHSRDGKFPPNAKIVVTNYERLHYFNEGDFIGVVCDEAGILKNYEGKTKALITNFMRKTPYRLLCTATAAPNDYVELGTASEALGQLGYQDMLTKFFVKQTAKDHRGWGRTNYRMRTHAERHFWRWVCSWARACRKPSDLGFEDGKYALPPLVTSETIIKANTLPDGFMFEVPAESLQEQRKEQRRTLEDRCGAVGDLVKRRQGEGHDRSIAWCQLNDEAALLRKTIPNSREVGGSTPEEEREEIIEWFTAPSSENRVLVSKGTVFGFGLNLQRCAHMAFFPSHSFEQHYQSVRRCWRFGQDRPVYADIVTTEGGRGVLANLQRKSDAAEEMFAKLVELMNDSFAVDRIAYGEKEAELPRWLSAAGIV